MIGKTDIKELEFESIEEYFEYIIDSEINGQRKQVQSLIDDLSKSQKKDALKYLSETWVAPEKLDALQIDSPQRNKDAEIVKKLIIESF